jgi:hypothetical protein
VHTQEICTTKTDGTQVCVTGDELAAMLTAAGGPQSPAGQLAAASALAPMGGTNDNHATTTLTGTQQAANDNTAAKAVDVEGDDQSLIKNDPKPTPEQSPSTMQDIVSETANDNIPAPTAEAI